MVRENKGLTVKEELEIILENEDKDSDFGFPVSSPDGNETRAFLYDEKVFDNYIDSASPLCDLNYQYGKTRKN